MPADEGDDADGEPFPERVLAGEGDAETGPGEDDEGGQHGGDAHEPQLFADDAEDHVRVRFGQVVHLGDPVTEADAERPAGAERDQRLHRLETRALGVLPRIEEAEDARAAVRLEPDREQSKPNSDSARGCERHTGRPRGDEHRDQHDHERDRGAEVGLGEDQHAEEAEQEADRPPQLAQRARRRPAREVGGRPHRQGELRQLRRLERRGPDLDPPARAVDARADREHCEAAGERRQYERGREQSQAAVVETRGGHHQEDAEQRIAALLLQVGHRVGLRERGGRRRRAVHHHEPERDQAERDEHEHVRLELSLLHQRSPTSRRNVSPRCS